jgi:hypothetical protein
MILCTKCRKKFNGLEAQTRKFGKSKKVQCPFCSEWIEYAKAVR